MSPWTAVDRARSADERLVLGLMSGMSMDGIDIALARISEGDDPRRPHVELVAGDSYAYDDDERARIRAALEGRPDSVAALASELGRRWARDVVDFLELQGVDVNDVAAIGSHGQTIHHTPRDGDASARTLQVGDPALLAAGTGLPVVADFRQADIAAGGEGAPLIPLADWILFGGPDAVTACQNLGNIANVTVLTPALEDVLAFDTGPANALIDAAARTTEAGRAAGGMDKDGALSASGTLDEDLLLALYTKRSTWMAQKPPKSAGFETFGPGLLEEVGTAFEACAPADRMRTVVEYTALLLRDAYAWHVVPHFPELERVRFSGGGCHNPTLMVRVEALLEELGLAVERLDPSWTDLKEAVGFALLADRTLRGLPGNVPGATGAERPVVLGSITLPPG